MRYSPDHTIRTRHRILEQAGRLFRRHGYRGVGIEHIMRAARLTRGGFYGYFRSKVDLFAEVLQGEHGFVRLMRGRTGRDRATLAREARRIVRDYLHPAHRERVGRGCYFVSVATDVARAPRPARQAFEGQVLALAGEFERSLEGATPLDPRALAAMSLCVGGLTLARAVDDEAVATALLDAAREAAERALAAPPGGPRPAGLRE
jgi:TetR/AcrR family transcriptional repressor of nem operon